MKTLLLYIAAYLLVLPLPAQNQADSGEVIYRLYFIGDAGEDYPEAIQNLQLLKQQLEKAGPNSGVIFLGDNIYPQGLPDEGDPNRAEAEEDLLAQLKTLDGFSGTKIFIPGNHDWQKGKKRGWQYVLRQEEFVEKYFDNDENIFLPDQGCPGPVELILNEEIVLIIVDTQWLLHPWQKPEEDSYCDFTNTEAVLTEVEDLLKKHQNKKVVVATHHPMLTYGSHGGYYTISQHIFPLLDLNKNLFIPLPALGSIYPIYRSFFGNIQDTPHPEYKYFRKRLMNYFADFPNTIHIAGHEHALQYITKDSVHYVVSGSGAKSTPVKKGRLSHFASRERGFSQLVFYQNGDVKLEMWESTSETEAPVYEKTIFNKPYLYEETAAYYDENIDFSDSTVMVKASSQYEASRMKKFWMGENYRDVWSTPIEVPVFDIGQKKGGLEIIKKGGGQATKSLRLEAENGRQYVLRSIDKNPEKAIPEDLRNTFAADLVQDQISAAHPYGAFVLPPMAEAAGLYHTNPELVYIPDDPRLGAYRADFANTLAMFEERADDDYWEDYQDFGNSEEIYSYSNMLEELEDDNDNEVDQHFVLRNRLFDLIIGDWDRHDDQWRWASFEKKGEKGLLFRPIPRDRDQAFFVNEGFLPKIISRRWALPKFEGFNPEVRWVEGFNFNGRYFDRSYMTELSLADWLAMADTLQNRLTDEVFAEALKRWPEKIYEKDHERILRVLKSRRDHLREYAVDYYMFLAEKVNVVGSDKHERFEVKRLNDRETEVTVYKTYKEGDIVKKIYQRTFFTDETKEIRLYGRDGHDQFYVEGNVKKGIKIRIIGGDDDDIIVDKSRVRGWGKKTLVYDEKEEDNQLNLSGESKNLSSRRKEVNDYDRLQFKYDVAIPLIYGTFNQDDGVYLGAGALVTTHGFRKEPYATQHLLLGRYAFRTNSVDTRYRGDFTDVINRVDIRINADVRLPSYVTNYFGLGNETENLANGISGPLDIDFYRTRFELIEISALLKYNFGNNSQLLLGPLYQSFELQDEGSDKFIYDFENNDLDPENAFDSRYFGGLQINFELDTRDQSAIPTSGVFLNLQSRFLKDFKQDNNFSNLQGELALYHNFVKNGRLTFATRFGGGINFGSFDFFQANVLDGTSNLRGYRKSRFYGRSSFFNNFEARYTLFRFDSYIFPGSFGLLAFNDLGRVWVDDKPSNKWHHGYGGGIWLSPLDMAVASFMLGFSEEESPIPLIKFNFLF